MAQIGDLGVRLTADVQQFKDKLKSAEQSVTGLRDKATKGFEDIGGAVSRINQPLGGLISSLGSFKTAGPAAFLAVGAAAGTLVANTAAAAAEIENLSRIAGTGTTEFQRMAAAASTVGINQEKLSDQLKDFNEKMGEFFQSGAGPMKDFFELIAPKIGITAEAFRKLSGPEALQLYYDSLQKAGLSQQEMSWHLETMGSDLTNLIPLLADGGAKMKELGDKAEETGKVIDKETVVAAKKLHEQMLLLKDITVGVATQIGSVLIPVLLDLTNEFNASMKAAGGFWNGIAMGFAAGPENVVRQGQQLMADLDEVNAKIAKFTAPGLAGKGESDKIVEGLQAQRVEIEKNLEAHQKYLNAYYGAYGTGPRTPLAPAQTGDAVVPPKGSKAGKVKDNTRELQQLFLESELAKQLSTDYDEQARRIRLVNDALAATPTAVLERQRELMKFLAQEVEAGRISVEQFNEATTTALGNVPNELEDISNKIISVQTIANDAAKMMTRSFVDFATSSDRSFSEFAKNFLANIGEMIIQAMVLNTIKTAGGAMAGAGGIMGTIGAALLGSANGNAFENGRPVQQFANGGIISQPVRFPLAGGRTGEAGEAGVEGIFPLIRKNGKLGVHAVGAGTTNNSVVNHIEVTVQGGNQDPDQLGQKVADQVVRALVRSEVANQMRSGGLLNGR